MDKKQAMAQFNKADALYRDGHHAEALALLDALNALYPNTPNILLPRVRCLYRLKRVREAIDVCDVLITQHKNERAARLKQSILDKVDRPGSDPPGALELPGAINLDDLLGPPPAPPAPKAEKASIGRFPWLSTPVIIVLAVLVGFVVITGLALMTGDSHKAPSTSAAEVAAAGEVPSASTEPEQGAPPIRLSEDGDIAVYGWKLSRFGWSVVMFVLIFVLYTVSLYCTLRVGNKLPSEELSDNLINVGAISFIGAILAFIPCLGLIASIVILRRTYELTFIEFFILFAFYVAASIVTFGIVMFIVVALGVGLAAS